MRGRKRQRKKNDRKLMRGMRFGYTDFITVFDRVTKRHIEAQILITCDMPRFGGYLHNFPDEGPRG
jgi:hypothetical protein